MATFAQGIAAVESLIPKAELGAEMAANEMAALFKATVRGEMTVGHPLHTQTPRTPGEPPAWISMTLRNSLINEPAIPVGDATYLSRSGPTALWSRIQELGGEMHAHSDKGMRWQEPPGVWHRSMQHYLPPRPYMLPAHYDLIDSGALTEACAAVWSAVLRA